MNSSTASAADQELFDFLSPPQGPGELGWLGQYRVLKILGSGGMGVVLHAEDRKPLGQRATKISQTGFDRQGFQALAA